MGGEDGSSKGWIFCNLEKRSDFIHVCACVCIGGTVDITVHEIQENRCLKELHKACGGGWGGNRVDENLNIFLREVFDDGVWDEYVKSYPIELQRMMNDFSFQKCSADREAVYLIATTI